MRFHLLGLPSAPVHSDYPLCGFCQMTLRFQKLLKAIGGTVILYGAEGSATDVCDEFVQIITDEERLTLLGATEYQHAAIEEKTSLWQLSNPRIISAIAARKQPGDFILTIGGASQQPVMAAHPDLMDVEYSIGYIGSFARYKVFESHIWRHTTHGFTGNDNGRWFDDVIPCFYEPERFPFQAERTEDYLLYCGRLVQRKGVQIACETAQRAGLPLRLIGHGDPSLITYGDYLGPLSNAEMYAQMAGARAVFCPTTYIEPFGQTACEAQMCGTPVISSAFGGFVETVAHGITGFRCSYLGEFLDATERVLTLDRAAIRRRAHDLWSFDVVARQYARYFQRLQLLWQDGWYATSLLTEATHG